MRNRLDTGATSIVVTVAAAVVVLDLASKWVAHREFSHGSDHWLLEGIVGLELVRNRGVAFGLLEGRWFTFVTILAALLALVLLISSTGSGDSWIRAVAGGAMLGGAIGNLIDRLPDGTVTDFVAIGPWPRFNAADTALTLGLVLLIGQYARQPNTATAAPMGDL